MKKLPKKFRGARVERGKSMDGDEFDTTIEEDAYSNWSDAVEVYVVVEDKIDVSPCADVQVFADYKTALRIAKARSNGNCDHRVLRVTEQTLVVATENEL